MAVECLDERTVLDFLNGTMTAEARREAHAHIATCRQCADLVTFAAAELTRPGDPSRLAGSGFLNQLAAGSLVGRYLILELIGRGGMGEVYAAKHPELDRRIALKVVTDSGADVAERRSRLLREARAIARLSHPNVVTVHDAGTADDRVYIAMELVEGVTLDRWLKQAPHDWRAILDVFIKAGRGLAAAHEVGIVHRDFKPQNVMIGRDGSVRVTDFGLARLEGEDVPPSEQSEGEGESDARHAGLTKTGAVLGTPAYMAPEQYRREKLDARADEFSFCVALYEALYGTRPALAHLADAVEDAASEDAGPSRSTRPPVWLRGALLRGLEPDREKRFPSMEQLLGILERGRTRLRRRAQLLAAAAAVTLLAFGGWRLAHRQPYDCQAGSSRLADSWTGKPMSEDPRRQAIQAAFMATGLPAAKDSWDRVAALLDRYAASWLNMYRDSCEATHLRGEQSTDVLDLRTACLEDRHQALKALTDVFSSADKQSASKAIDAVNALPSLDRCADVNLLRAVVEPPHDPTMRARVADLRRRAAATKALFDTGRDQQALGQARALVSEARALGYLPLTAELLLMRGSFAQSVLVDSDSASTLEEAVRIAIRARRDDIAAEAATDLVWNLGYFQKRPEDGARWADLADAFLDRLGEENGLTKGWLLNNRAAMMMSKDPAAALRYAEQAFELKRKLLPPDHPDIALALDNLAEAQHHLGNDAAAVEAIRRAEETFTKAYGPKNVFVAMALSNHGEYLVALGRPTEALPLLHQAVSRFEAESGPNTPFLGYPLTGIGRASLALGRPREALAPLEQALRVRELGEPDPAERAETRFALAQALWETGDRTRSIALAEQASKDYAKAGTPTPGHAVADWLADREPHGHRPRQSN